MAILRSRGAGQIEVEDTDPGPGDQIVASASRGVMRSWRSRSRKVILASAERVDAANAAKFRRITMPWQYAALGYYDSIGEIHYASGFYARAFQKVRLYVGERDGEGNIVPSENEQAQALLDRIQDPAGGRETICDRYGRLTFICGECYLLWMKIGPGDNEETWEICSIDELKPAEDGRSILRQKAPGLEIETIRQPIDDSEPQVGEGIAYRLWNPHPRWSFLADSPMRAVVDICDELYLLTLAVAAQAKSQAARAGLLLLPDELSNPEPAADVIGDEDPQEDPFFADLTEQITLPITDPAAAAALVPMIIRGNAEALKEIRRVGLFDEKVHYQEIELRKEAIRRIGLSLDMPPEVLLGLSESNHWTAWQIEQQAWAHLAPAATQMCMNLTSAYLRPAAKAEGIAGWEKLVVWYDAQELLANPDRGKDANELYDRRAIGKEALREAHGFTDDDAPTDQELEEMLLVALKKNVQVENGELVVEEEAPAETPAGPPTGEDTEKAAPDEAPDEVAAGTEADADGGNLNEMRVRLMTGAEMALWRIREIACTRAKAAAQGCPDCLAVIKDVDRDFVPHVLGRQTLRDLGFTAAKLVDGAGAFYSQHMQQWGVPEPVAARVAKQLEAIAARSLFDDPGTAPHRAPVESAVEPALA